MLSSDLEKVEMDLKYLGLFYIIIWCIKVYYVYFNYIILWMTLVLLIKRE